jgi:hypothetical protein
LLGLKYPERTPLIVRETEGKGEFLIFVRKRERIASHFKGASMARISLGEFDPTTGTPSWAASLDECCVVKDPRRKKKREVNERGAVSL